MDTCQHKNSTPYILRAATRAEQSSIRQLIFEAKINPFGLKWHNFIVAINPEGKVIGCGQIKFHWDGSRELASIAVKEAWRRRGIASAIIHALINKHPAPIYLICRASLEAFYQSFGFQRQGPGEMSVYFRRLYQVSKWLHALGILKENLLIMQRK